ncbi:MAG: spore germination protein [Christensenellaceae bacterium]|jgi:spore germination protein KA|nr:spore germination protein [Christensenellaceae bacterium]
MKVFKTRWPFSKGGKTVPNFDNPPPSPREKPPEPPEALFASLDKNLELLREMFHSPLNKDFIVREFISAGTPCAVLSIEGFVDRKDIEDHIMRPLMHLSAFSQRPSRRDEDLLNYVLPLGNAGVMSDPVAISKSLLIGNVAILLDGCPRAILCEAQGMQRRSVGLPLVEGVVSGPNQAFNESMRVNIALVRSVLKSPDFVTELVDVGKSIKSSAAICYMQNIANPTLVEEVKRRIRGIDKDVIYNVGEINQLIEDKPFALIPQGMLTERPDRAAAFAMDGMILILYDNSPHALCVPVTISHFVQTSEDSFLRWQYGSLIRITRIFGTLIALLLPAMYNALILFHQELLPLELLTSLVEGHVLVPFPATVELVLMIGIFDLLNEAGIRMPNSLGSTLGIIGALVLGQAAVAANLISPALIIIVSITGLGSFSVPSYSLALAIRIRRYAYIVISTLLGFVGIALMTLCFLMLDCGVESFGVPVLSPFTPKMPHNPDSVFRLPISLQRMIPPMFRPKQRTAARNPRGWEEENSPNE